jgi:cobalt/nickel transport system permease protein
LHHVTLEEWSRRASPLHRRDPRAKAAVLVAFLVMIATSRAGFEAWLALLAVAALAARLPLAGILLRAAVVLPFTGVFSLITWLSGDPARAFGLLAKSYLSALAVLVLVGTTPMPALLRGLESLGVPHFLLLVGQFLYRYLFVISEEAQHMRTAAQARGGMRFRAAAGALAVLFARSYGRAEEIHRAMAARGFNGRFGRLQQLRFGWADGAFAASACALAVAARVLGEGRVP